LAQCHHIHHTLHLLLLFAAAAPNVILQQVSWNVNHHLLSPLSLCGAAAPTVILQQVYDPELRTSVPEAAAASVLVWPQRGSYCLFDGRLAHGVLDSCSSSLRATLLVNWWAQRPQVG
jgi:hypothetical protein